VTRRISATRIALPDGEIQFIPRFLPKTRADAYFQWLLDAADWEQHEIRIGGRIVASPRLSAWYGDPGATYRYSGLFLEPRPWLPVIEELKVQVEKASGWLFNSVLLNLYRDGSDSMGWHSDDEPELGQRPVIASISLGATRRFRLRHKKQADLEPVVVGLEHGSLLIMKGETQRFWKHQLPKTKRVSRPRINLTFRRICAAPSSSIAAGG
jgi:alkylated DNA repair dioxygenase AlkB